MLKGEFMKIQIIGSKEIRINKLTKYGRKRNQAIQELKNKGCQVIREYKENFNSRVLLGYKDNSSDMAAYAFRVCRNGCSEEKHSYMSDSSLSPSVTTYYVDKVKKDGHGNEEVINKEITIDNGNVVERRCLRKLNYLLCNTSMVLEDSHFKVQ